MDAGIAAALGGCELSGDYDGKARGNGLAEGRLMLQRG
jgi:hypothetical protein